MTESAWVREVGLRDGLQMIATFMPTAQKTEWIDRCCEAGFSELEVCAFVPAKYIPQFSDAEAVVAHSRSKSGLVAATLVPNLQGAERALEAGARGSVVSLQLRGMTADFLRGAALTVVAYAFLAPLAAKCVQLWSADARISRCVIVGLAASVAGGAAWKLFHSTLGARWFFVGGLALGLFMLFLK